MLIQVDLAGETPSSARPADAARRVMDAAVEARALVAAGLMLLPPWNEDQEQTPAVVPPAAGAARRAGSRGRSGRSLRHLSMGMSHDFEAAIEEGATMVRVGTAIFGKRSRPNAEG